MWGRTKLCIWRCLYNDRLAITILHYMQLITHNYWNWCNLSRATFCVVRFITIWVHNITYEYRRIYTIFNTRMTWIFRYDCHHHLEIANKTLRLNTITMNENCILYWITNPAMMINLTSFEVSTLYRVVIIIWKYHILS